MALYEYKCPKCENVREVEHSVKTEYKTFCACDKYEPTQMIRQISKSAFVLKGSGWAKDGYK